MHNHFDRDHFVEIIWRNINEDELSNFKKVDQTKFGNFGTNYDFYSVMHYNTKAFSSNGQETIVPRDSYYRNIIGQRKYLSAGDAKRINNMYECFQ